MLFTRESAGKRPADAFFLRPELHRLGLTIGQLQGGQERQDLRNGVSPSRFTPTTTIHTSSGISADADSMLSSCHSRKIRGDAGKNPPAPRTTSSVNRPSHRALTTRSAPLDLGHDVLHAFGDVQRVCAPRLPTLAADSPASDTGR